MSKPILTNEEFNRTLKGFENSETGEYYLDEIVDFLERHKDDSESRRKMYEYFKTIHETLQKGVMKFKLPLPNGKKSTIIGIPTSAHSRF